MASTILDFKSVFLPNRYVSAPQNTLGDKFLSWVKPGGSEGRIGSLAVLLGVGFYV